MTAKDHYCVTPTVIDIKSSFLHASPRLRTLRRSWKNGILPLFLHTQCEAYSLFHMYIPGMLAEGHIYFCTICNSQKNVSWNRFGNRTRQTPFSNSLAMVPGRVIGRHNHHTGSQNRKFCKDPEEHCEEHPPKEDILSDSVIRTSEKKSNFGSFHLVLVHLG